MQNLHPDILTWISGRIFHGARVLCFGSAPELETLVTKYNVTCVDHRLECLIKYKCETIHAPLVEGYYDSRIVHSKLVGQKWDLIIYNFDSRIRTFLNHIETLGLRQGVPIITNIPRGDNWISNSITTRGYNARTSANEQVVANIHLPASIQLYTCIGVDDIQLLPHFLEYYRYGIDNIYALVNSDSVKNPKLKEVKKILDDYSVYHEDWIGTFSTNDKSRKLVDLIDRFQVPYGWCLHSDVDEQHVYPWNKDIRLALTEADNKGVTMLGGRMIERCTVDGSLPDVKPDIPLDIQFPVKFITAMQSHKVCASRPFVPVTNGGWHYASIQPLHCRPNKVEVFHYRWNSATKARYEKRLVDFRIQSEAGTPHSGHFNNSKRRLDYMQDGKLNLKHEQITLI